MKPQRVVLPCPGHRFKRWMVVTSFTFQGVTIYHQVVTGITKRCALRRANREWAKRRVAA